MILTDACRQILLPSLDPRPRSLWEAKLTCWLLPYIELFMCVSEERSSLVSLKKQISIFSIQMWQIPLKCTDIVHRRNSQSPINHNCSTEETSYTVYNELLQGMAGWDCCVIAVLTTSKAKCNSCVCLQDEKQRIEALGGCVIWFGTWRVNGSLSVSRAIGNE